MLLFFILWINRSAINHVVINFSNQSPCDQSFRQSAKRRRPSLLATLVRRTLATHVALVRRTLATHVALATPVALAKQFALATPVALAKNSPSRRIRPREAIRPRPQDPRAERIRPYLRYALNQKKVKQYDK